MAIQPKLALWQRNAPLLIQLRAGLSRKEKEQLLSPLGTQDGWVAGTEKLLHFLLSFAARLTWETMFWPDTIWKAGATGFNWGRALLPLSNIHTCKEYSSHQPPYSSEQVCEMSVIISLFLLHFGYAMLGITAMQYILRTFHLRSTWFFQSLHEINVRHCKGEVCSKISTDVKT